MKTFPTRQQGAVLVFALLVLVVGATLLGGIAQLAVTQSIAGQAEWEVAAKRIRVENSRALARQFILTQMWRGFGGVPRATLSNSVTGGNGGFAITNVEPPFGYWLSLPQESDDRINPFTLFERGGFQSAWINANLWSGSNETSNNIVAWGFQVRTRSPIMAGFAFVNQRDAINTWSPDRRINMKQPDYASGFSALPRIPISSITNTQTASSDLSMIDLGFMSAPKAEARFGDVSDTNFTGLSPDPMNEMLTVDIETFNYDGSPAADDNRFLEIANVVTSGTNTAPLRELQLAGSPTYNPTPIQIYIPSTTTNLTTITLLGSNKRFVYLYRHGTNQINIATGGGSLEWDFAATLQCDARLDVAGQLQVTGGIRTSGLLTQVSANAPTFFPMMNPTWNDDAIADRMMWLEDQRER